MLGPSSPFREGFQNDPFQKVDINQKEKTSDINPKEISPSPLPDSVTAILNSPPAEVTKELGSASSKGYQLVTRHVDISLDNYLNKEQEINQLGDALTRGDWKDPIFNDPNSYPFYALAALKKGKISLESFTTILFFWSAHRDLQRTKMSVKDFLNENFPIFHFFEKFPEYKELPELKPDWDSIQSALKPLKQAGFNLDEDSLKPDSVQIIPLFQDGKVNPIAKDMISSTLSGPHQQSYLTDEQIDQFFEKMKQVSASERYLFSFPDPQFIEVNDELHFFNPNAETISQRLKSSEIEVNTFFEARLDTTPGTPPACMVPSFSMRQAFLDVKFGPNATKITPVIGLATEEDIRENGLTQTREMSLAFPGVEMPRSADGYPAPRDIDFIHHDFYHAFICSYIPQPIQKAFIEAADLTPPQDPKKKASDFMTLFHDTIVDMEHASYRPKNRGNYSDSELFWLSLSNSFDVAVSKYRESTYKSIDQSSLNKEAAHFVRRLVNSFLENPQLWADKGLSLKDFNSAFEKQNFNQPIRKSRIVVNQTIKQESFMDIVKKIYQEDNQSQKFFKA